MSEDSLEWYGGVLAAPARSGWRTVLDVIGVLDLIAAAVLVAVAFSPDGRSLVFVDNSDHAYLCSVSDQRGATSWFCRAVA
jgi:hypothetical protein